MPKMNVLSPLEQEEFDSPPVFNSVERKQAFDFPVGVMKYARKLDSSTNQAMFLLHAGYFRVSGKFFSPKDFSERDLEYVCGGNGIDPENVDYKKYARTSFLRHRKWLLSFYGYRGFDKKSEEMLEREMQEVVASQFKPRMIFLHCLDVLSERKVELPTYFRLSELVLQAQAKHREKLTRSIQENISEETTKLLDSLLDKSQKEPGRYVLTLLKRISQSTRPKKIRESISDFEIVKELWEKIKPLVDALDLSPKALRYFAHSVMKTKSPHSTPTTLSNTPEKIEPPAFVAFSTNATCYFILWL